MSELGKGSEAAKRAAARHDRPAVSIIMIFLNAEEWIGQAIDSVIDQTFDDWELLLVDDGSSDGSTAICHQYCLQDPARVRYFDHPGHENRGTGASRNLGVIKARGEFIAFLDADDVFVRDRIERHVRILREVAEIGTVQSQYQFWHSWRDQGRETLPDVEEPPPLGEIGGAVSGRVLMLMLAQTRGAIATGICNLTIRRELLMAVGGFDESFRGLYEDQVLQAKVYLAAPVYLLNECLARYRQHPDSVCAVAKDRMEDLNGRRFEPQHMFLEWLRSYVTEVAPADHELLATVDRWLAIYRRPPFIGELVRLRRKLLRRLKNLLPQPVRQGLLRLWRHYKARQARHAVRVAMRSAAGQGRRAGNVNS